MSNVRWESIIGEVCGFKWAIGLCNNLICIYILIVRKMDSVNYINVSTTWKVYFLVIDSHVCGLVVFVGPWKYIFLMIYKLFTEAKIEMFLEQYWAQSYKEMPNCLQNWCNVVLYKETHNLPCVLPFIVVTCRCARVCSASK